MKTNRLYLIAVFGMLLTLGSCRMDYYPSDEQSSDVIMKEASAMIMDGCYALLKDEVEYLGYPSGNTYCRHYFQMAEFPADNICLSGRSTDPLFQATTYTMTDNLQNVGTLWMIGYKAINMTNTLIGTLDESQTANKQTLGEAYFMRALLHLNMVTLYAKPYSYGRDNMGVPLRTTMITDETKRNSVGMVYDQIVADLKKASALLATESRGNAGYPCKDAALGLLSRVYLYMEDYDNCIAIVNEMLGSASPASKLDPDLSTYFANAKTSKETLFCIAHEMIEDRGQSSIGSMYNKDGGGWGEVYPSFPLLALYSRYPMDVRYSAFILPKYKDDAAPSTTYKFYIPNGETGTVKKRDVKKVTGYYDSATDSYYFFDEGVKYTIEKRLVQGEYPEYHVNYKGEDLLIMYLPENMDTRETYPKFYVKKIGYQDGIPTLSSPVVLRWAEVILNRAEAYARTGEDAKALADVDAIRTRAGIPAAGLFSSNMHGYTNVIDIVMDERRLELAFEGHRMFDVFRNKKNMNRQYPGVQEWKEVLYTDPHTQYPIPNGEWTVSHITQNPGY